MNENEVELAVLSLPETVSSVRLPSRLCVLVCVPWLANSNSNVGPLAVTVMPTVPDFRPGRGTIF